MNTVRRIAKNTGVLLFAQIASYILGFFLVIYKMMRCSFALAFTGILGVFRPGLSCLGITINQYNQC